jgi:hypothetical protein
MRKFSGRFVRLIYTCVGYERALTLVFLILDDDKMVAR